MVGQGKDGVMIEYKDQDGNIIVIDPEAQYREQSNKPIADTLSALIQGDTRRDSGIFGTSPLKVF